MNNIILIIKGQDDLVNEIYENALDGWFFPVSDIDMLDPDAYRLYATAEGVEALQMDETAPFMDCDIFGDSYIFHIACDPQRIAMMVSDLAFDYPSLTFQLLYYNAEEEEIGSATYCGTQVVKGFYDSIPVAKM